MNSFKSQCCNTLYQQSWNASCPMKLDLHVVEEPYHSVRIVAVKAGTQLCLIRLIMGLQA